MASKSSVTGYQVKVKYMEDLTTAELEAELRKVSLLANDKGLLSRLPDRGHKLLKQLQALTDHIAFRRSPPSPAAADSSSSQPPVVVQPSGCQTEASALPFIEHPAVVSSAVVGSSSSAQ